MIADMLEFLRTNSLGKIEPGLKIDEVRQYLGEPDDIAVTSGKHPKPTIFRYGSIEIYFDTANGICTWIFLEAREDDAVFHFPKAYTHVEWDLPPFATIDQVAAFLTAHQIDYSHKKLSRNNDSLWSETTITASDMHLTFNDEGLLFAFASGRSALSER